MKLLATDWKCTGAKHIWNCGAAALFRLADGRFELRGGSRDDRLEALEWASLFEHDAVFDPTCPPKNPEQN
ncbi:MAG: hypothetical protein ACKVHO_03240 [Verrucomicrobiia bacterium]|jgi:hypothetical protein